MIPDGQQKEDILERVQTENAISGNFQPEVRDPETGHTNLFAYPILTIHLWPQHTLQWQVSPITFQCIVFLCN
jgi:hypothetical protein